MWKFKVKCFINYQKKHLVKKSCRKKSCFLEKKIKKDEVEGKMSDSDKVQRFFSQLFFSLRDLFAKFKNRR